VSKPRHGVDPQSDMESLGVKFSKSVGSDGVVSVRVAGDQFRGLLVKTVSAGVFLPGEGLVTVECNGFLGSSGPDTTAVTHSHSADKTEVNIRFSPDDGVQQETHFEIVILKNFTTFWSGIVI